MQGVIVKDKPEAPVLQDPAERYIDCAPEDMDRDDEDRENLLNVLPDAPKELTAGERARMDEVLQWGGEREYALELMGRKEEELADNFADLMAQAPTSAGSPGTQSDTGAEQSSAQESDYGSDENTIQNQDGSDQEYDLDDIDFDAEGFDSFS